MLRVLSDMANVGCSETSRDIPNVRSDGACHVVEGMNSEKVGSFLSAEWI